MSNDTLEYWYGITPKDLKAMSDNASKREIHRLAIASDGVNNPIEAKFCNGDPILTIYPDGRITVSDELKPDETAAMVLQMVKEHWLADPQAKKIRELEAELEQLKAKLSQSEQQLFQAIGRIMQLVDAGDALSDRSEVDIENWRKAKEAKP